MTKLEQFVAGVYTSPRLRRLVEEEAARLGSDRDWVVLRGIVAARQGVPLETISKLVDWRSFERFCKSVLEASGFETWENIVLTKPRMQVDVVAADTSVVLSVDCKHWAASAGSSTLARAARRQIERSRRLGGFLPIGGRPIISTIVTVTDQPQRFVAGAAVVPIHTLRDFAAGALSYADMLEVS